MFAKLVWVEINWLGEARRIFKNQRTAIAAGPGISLQQQVRAIAVSAIRKAVFERDEYKCQHCGALVTWGSGEMHERKWRGRGGEISIANCVVLCHTDHEQSKVAGHGNRRVRFGEKVK